MELDDYQQSLLSGWEEVFKKGQLTLWIALALKAGPKRMSEIKDFIAELTNGTSEVDDRSIYRALRRYHQADIVEFDMAPSDGGPEHKIYRLTINGEVLVRAFCKRNIVDVFYRPEIKKLVEGETA
ncbi:MAG TPA: PadR family transcriptional regulator [Candidatus Saccharimonadales bacterium]